MREGERVEAYLAEEKGVVGVGANLVKEVVAEC